MITETLLEIQRLLDEHPAEEQAQARAFVDARYPAPPGWFKTSANAPPGEPVHEPDEPGANAPLFEPNAPVHEPKMNKRFWSSSFLKFWSEYPRKTGKKEALRIWLRIKPNQELQEKILHSVREQKTSESWTRENGQFIPHPKTWLNQERWDDEPVQRTGAFLSDKTRCNADAAKAFMEHMHDQQ